MPIVVAEQEPAGAAAHVLPFHELPEAQDAMKLPLVSKVPPSYRFRVYVPGGEKVKDWLPLVPLAMVPYGEYPRCTVTELVV